MNRFLRVSENLAALFLLLIALLVTVNVTLRYVLSIQIPDWFDFSRQLQAIAIFWGIAIATYRGGPHLRRRRLGAPGAIGQAAARSGSDHRHPPVPDPDGLDDLGQSRIDRHAGNERSASSAHSVLRGLGRRRDGRRGAGGQADLGALERPASPGRRGGDRTWTVTSSHCSASSPCSCSWRCGCRSASPWASSASSVLRPSPAGGQASICWRTCRSRC